MVAREMDAERLMFADEPSSIVAPSVVVLGPQEREGALLSARYPWGASYYLLGEHEPRGIDLCKASGAPPPSLSSSGSIRGAGAVPRSPFGSDRPLRSVEGYKGERVRELIGKRSCQLPYLRQHLPDPVPIKNPLSKVHFLPETLTCGAPNENATRF
jgi:hypothetical protein